VQREILEEAGLQCVDVRYYMTQPWPYPSSLMIGCTARATTTDIVADRSELEDARWFDRAEAETMLERTHPQGLSGPHPVAIAHHLLGDCCGAARPERACGPGRRASRCLVSAEPQTLAGETQHR